MNLPKRLLKTTKRIWSKIDPFSLQVRLTVGIAAFSAMGLSGVAIWMSWKMQQILVTSQKQNIEYLANRFPHDVEIYSDMVSVETGIQRAIDNLTTDKTILWVRNPSQLIVAQSHQLKIKSSSHLLTSKMEPSPQLYKLQGHYWVACGADLQVKSKNLGKVYIAKDITSEQIMFLSLIKTLAIASVFSIAVITLAIAIYIQKSLKPLHRISAIAKTISANDLGQARLDLERVPSEVKELAQTFETMLLRLSEAWEMQRQFVSNFSHELRTPLTIVSGYLQSTLRRGKNLTQQQQEALVIAVSETDRTIQLLKDLLDLARADNGKMHFNIESIILNKLVSEIVEMAIQYSNRIITVEATEEIIIAKADPDRLKQVLLNLIDNAVKYSESDRPVILKLDKQNEQAKIEIWDKGRGIPLAQQSRIFERFYRVDENRAKSIGGTGLGLSIVKTLVEGMGGNITVRSQPEKGSIFTVTLPGV
ncbi:MAG TPA: two-component sensor histidine kinase [Cyanobacteria bacterium UBA11149]|nr:two-component sensor histidine kinase [Cyanobacteria bacterium UBA11367]HBE60058.1 two-component sensor histidine kinase [Cyanobacteria bacterium UBA11366]HBK62972.1 two-component sensor histidine kinase [Cyanobacteria bacterium UBA11166]HBR75119.1 two-component sensor histidine kinase [Cyanobacteria bacterium UBA11159]HBS68388.1 two-component sensor histidine kinase [Cyanobacteria bacterium UBA11153]HBW87895.1 two-component sensor histidine kinase [Cyanobacteria bacterium UBA11149]HCA9651